MLDNAFYNHFISDTATDSYFNDVATAKRICGYSNATKFLINDEHGGKKVTGFRKLADIIDDMFYGDD